MNDAWSIIARIGGPRRSRNLVIATAGSWTLKQFRTESDRVAGRNRTDPVVLAYPVHNHQRHAAASSSVSIGRRCNPERGSPPDSFSTVRAPSSECTGNSTVCIAPSRNRPTMGDRFAIRCHHSPGSRHIRRVSCSSFTAPKACRVGRSTTAPTCSLIPVAPA